MKDLFTTEDFIEANTYFKYVNKTITLEVAAKLANLKLNKIIDSWPTVTAWKGSSNADGSGIRPLKIDWCEMQDIPNQTHKARLAFIEEIVKEPCQHEPITYPFDVTGPFGKTKILSSQCQHCGVELVAEWKQK